MVKTKIDHAIFWCTVTSNTTGNLSLSAHIVHGCVYLKLQSLESCIRSHAFDHQNYWPMEKLNHHRCRLKPSCSCEKKKLLLEGHFCVVRWCDILRCFFFLQVVQDHHNLAILQGLYEHQVVTWENILHQVTYQVLNLQGHLK